MALWGNNDNLNNAGTVSLDYSTGVVTGTGTTFGAAGAGHTEARVGDIIRFGHRDATDAGISTYFGDAEWWELELPIIHHSGDADLEEESKLPRSWI